MFSEQSCDTFHLNVAFSQGILVMQCPSENTSGHYVKGAWSLSHHNSFDFYKPTRFYFYFFYQKLFNKYWHNAIMETMVAPRLPNKIKEIRILKYIVKKEKNGE